MENARLLRKLNVPEKGQSEFSRARNSYKGPRPRRVSGFKEFQLGQRSGSALGTLRGCIKIQTLGNSLKNHQIASSRSSRFCPWKNKVSYWNMHRLSREKQMGRGERMRRKGGREGEKERREWADEKWESTIHYTGNGKCENTAHFPATHTHTLLEAGLPWTFESLNFRPSCSSSLPKHNREAQANLFSCDMFC